MEIFIEFTAQKNIRRIPIRLEKRFYPARNIKNINFFLSAKSLIMPKIPKRDPKLVKRTKKF